MLIFGPNWTQNTILSNIYLFSHFIFPFLFMYREMWAIKCFAFKVGDDKKTHGFMDSPLMGGSWTNFHRLVDSLYRTLLRPRLYI